MLPVSFLPVQTSQLVISGFKPNNEPSILKTNLFHGKFLYAIQVRKTWKASEDEINDRLHDCTSQELAQSPRSNDGSVRRNGWGFDAHRSHQQLC